MEAAAQLMLHQLQEFGASNPDVGTKAMLDAFAEAGASPPCLTALVHVGANRVAQYQLAGNSILNISGFFITTMRGLAKEARALRWDVERLRMEDARKYVSQGQRLRGGRHATPDQETESTTQMNALPDQEPPEEQQMVVEAEAGEDDAETQAALEAERAWVERLQPTVGDWEGRQREVGMLWGFIRDALSPELNTAHRQSLHLLLPAADLDNRCLVLLTTLTYTARQTRIALLHKIEEKREKRLSGYFDTVRVELISVLPSWTKEGA